MLIDTTGGSSLNYGEVASPHKKLEKRMGSSCSYGDASWAITVAGANSEVGQHCVVGIQINSQLRYI